MPNRVVIHAGFIPCIGLAVDDVASTVHQRLQESTRLFRKRVLCPVTRSVDPPDLTTRRGRSQRVQHGEYGRSSDAGTEQNDRPIAGPQREASPRRTDLENIADVYVINRADDRLECHRCGTGLGAVSDDPKQGMVVVERPVASLIWWPR